MQLCIRADYVTLGDKLIGAKKAVNLATILATIWRLYVKNSRQKSLNDTKR